MDRITANLLGEFSHERQLEQLPEDKQFEHFAAYLTISRQYGENFDTADVVTGAGGDTGIDAIAIIVNGTLVTDPELVDELVSTNGYVEAAFVFVQARRSPNFQAAAIGNFGYGVRDFFQETPSLVRNDAVQSAAETANRIYANSGRMTRGKPSCRLFYVTSGKWTDDQNLVARLAAERDLLLNLNLFREVEYEPVDADAIQRLYQQSKNAISREFTFAQRTVFPDIPGVSEAYLGFVPANTFLSLLQDETGGILKSIFYDNVSDFQEYNPVNSEIRGTLESGQLRARFALMNNGITIIARTLRATGNRFYIEDYQIVNGCQTSHVLFDQRGLLDESVMVPLRLIATRDEEVTATIVKATNRQTEVREEQLVALGEFQKKLEMFFQAQEEPRRLYYERRSRQYNRTAGIEKTRIVTLPNLIRAYAAMFLEEPHRTTRNYGSLVERIGTDIFAADHQLEPYYLAALAAYRLEFLFRNQQLDAKYKAARYHLLLASRILATGQIPPRPGANQMVSYCTSLVPVFANATEAEALFKRAAEVVDAAAADNFHRDRIRTQPFTEDVLRLSRALNPPQEPG
jgi:hypothetical protein